VYTPITGRLSCSWASHFELQPVSMVTSAPSWVQPILFVGLFTLHVCKQVVPRCRCGRLYSKPGEEKMISKPGLPLY
jgi:hypothetical protein